MLSRRSGIAEGRGWKNREKENDNEGREQTQDLPQKLESRKSSQQELLVRAEKQVKVRAFLILDCSQKTRLPTVKEKIKKQNKTLKTLQNWQQRTIHAPWLHVWLGGRGKKETGDKVQLGAKIFSF